MASRVPGESKSLPHEELNHLLHPIHSAVHPHVHPANHDKLGMHHSGHDIGVPHTGITGGGSSPLGSSAPKE